VVSKSEKEKAREQMTTIVARAVEELNHTKWINFRIEEWDIRVKHGELGEATGVYHYDEGWMGWVTIRKIGDKSSGQIYHPAILGSDFAGRLNILLYFLPEHYHPHSYEFKVTLDEGIDSDFGERATILVRHWIVPRYENIKTDSCDDSVSCEGLVNSWDKDARNFSSDIISEYPCTVLAGIVPLPKPIISLDMPMYVDMLEVAEKFNCVVYGKVAG
jgi:hypothetical protein